MSRNLIGVNGAIALAEALKENHSITDVDLSRNLIGVNGAIALAEAIKINKSITSISLSNNNISDEGAIALAEAIKINKSITSISLSNNNISDEGAIALAEALKENHSITNVDLSQNQIGVNGARALAEALKENRSITNFNLSLNQIGVNGARTLAEAIKINKSITSINLIRNNIENEGAIALAEALKTNYIITELNLNAKNYRHIEKLISRNRANKNGRTTLMVATHKGNVKDVESITEARANIEATVVSSSLPISYSSPIAYSSQNIILDGKAIGVNEILETNPKESSDFIEIIKSLDKNYTGDRTTTKDIGDLCFEQIFYENAATNLHHITEVNPEESNDFNEIIKTLDKNYVGKHLEEYEIRNLFFEQKLLLKLIEEGSNEILKIILDYASWRKNITQLVSNLAALSEKVNNILIKAIETDNNEAVSLILKYLSDYGGITTALTNYIEDKTVLVYAIEKGNSEIFKIIFEHVKQIEEDAVLTNYIEVKTVLVHAIEKGNSEIFKTIFEYVKQIGELEIKEDIDDDGSTLLHIACSKGNVAIIGLLMDNGADLNKQNSNQVKPFELLPSFADYEHDEEVITTKVKTPNSSNKKRKFAEHQENSEIDETNSCISPKASNENRDNIIKILSYLKRHNIDLKAKYNENGTPILHYLLLAYGDTVVDLIFNKGTSRNQRSSAKKRKIKITEEQDAEAQLLIEEETKISYEKENVRNILDDKGNTALHFLCNGPNDKVHSVRALINYGANINAQNKDGQTPLHMAIRRGNVKIAELLLKSKDIDFNIQDIYKKSPLDYIQELEDGSSLKEAFKHLDLANKKSLSPAKLNEGFQELEKYINEEKEDSKVSLRDYQNACLASIFQEMKDIRAEVATRIDLEDGEIFTFNNAIKYCGFVKMATGTGKTNIFLALIKVMGLKSSIIVPTRTLAEQTKDRIKELYPDIRAGIINGDIKELGNQISIIVYDTFDSHYNGLILNDLLDSQLIILDEVHNSLTKSRKEIVDFFLQKKDRLILGFTATDKFSSPRKDGDLRSVSQLLFSKFFDLSIQKATELGILSPVEIETIKLDPNKITTPITTFSSTKNLGSSLNNFLNNNIEYIAEIVREKSPDEEPVLIFVPSINIANNLSRELNKNNKRVAECVHSQINKVDQILESHKNRNFQFLINVDILSTGYDDPGLKVLIDFFPTNSLITIAQRYGRITRILKDEEGTIFTKKYFQLQLESLSHLKLEDLVKQDFEYNDDQIIIDSLTPKVSSYTEPEAIFESYEPDIFYDYTYEGKKKHTFISSAFNEDENGSDIAQSSSSSIFIIEDEKYQENGLSVNSSKRKRECFEEDINSEYASKLLRTKRLEESSLSQQIKSISHYQSMIGTESAAAETPKSNHMDICYFQTKTTYDNSILNIPEVEKLLFSAAAEGNDKLDGIFDLLQDEEVTTCLVDAVRERGAKETLKILFEPVNTQSPKTLLLEDATDISTPNSYTSSSSFYNDLLYGSIRYIPIANMVIDSAYAAYVPTTDNLIKSLSSISYTVASLNGNICVSGMTGTANAAYSLTKGNYLEAITNSIVFMLLPQLTSKSVTGEQADTFKAIVASAAIVGFTNKAFNIISEYISGKLEEQHKAQYKYIQEEFAYIYEQFFGADTSYGEDIIFGGVEASNQNIDI